MESAAASAINSKYNSGFWVHLSLTALSWFIPFLFDWRLVLTAYSVVLMQFVFFGGCLMNRRHALEDRGNDNTFYAHLLEMIGFRFNRSKVKRFVRFWIYVILGSFSLLYQVALGYEPLIW